MVRKDLTGERFGHLLVLGLDEEFEKVRNGRQIRWICQCDCGTIKSIIGAELTRTKNPQRSCGCELHKRNKNFGTLTFNDLTGKRFGKLTVIERVGSNKQKYAIWKCKCDCGKYCEVSSRELLNLETLSCGCNKMSKQEKEVNKFLLQNNINFLTEYKFDDLKDILQLRFDFAIFDSSNQLKCLIEVQGKQHYEKNSYEGILKLQEHDQKKEQYCKDNNYHLYIIKYNEDTQSKLIEILTKEGVYHRT